MPCTKAASVTVGMSRKGLRASRPRGARPKSLPRLCLRHVVKVAPPPKYRLRVEFDDGVSGTIDLPGELDGEVFQPLRDEAVFRQVAVDEFGAVYWPNGPDPAPDAMHGKRWRRELA